MERLSNFSRRSARYALLCFSLLITTFCATSLPAQTDQPNSLGKGATLFQQNRPGGPRGDHQHFRPEWAPFYHGVASGDPLHDRVIIWTRVTPDQASGPEIEVEWRLATDPELTQIVREGSVRTNAGRDYTVKVDVTDLEPGATYYYGFSASGRRSLTGKTKTTPTDDDITHLRFGVVSCSNYQAGYFNAYARLAERKDLDAVIHLGDYIYEYAEQVYGDNRVWADRPVEPAGELLSLEDYRLRYSTYRLDTQLVRAHQQHAFISVWDDHESANDSYADGAENHDPATEGAWADRKANAKQAYFEWMPIRDDGAGRVYRSIRYGDLLELLMLDTRLEGRQQQINDITDPALYDPDRTILGTTQKNWLRERLAGSTARWKVIGQQILFAEFHVGWASSLVNMSYTATESAFLDIWDGYPAERSELLAWLQQEGIDNVVVLTGDFHSSFAADLPVAPVAVELQEVAGNGLQPFYWDTLTYEPATGGGSLAVEFATPSVTSANFDENSNPVVALFLQQQLNREFRIANGTISLGNPNPHLKYVDLIRHGYYLLDVRPDSVQANWYYSPILEIDPNESFAAAQYTRNGENHLQAAAGPSPEKEQQDVPAPAEPPGELTNTKSSRETQAPLILSIYPNPASSRAHIQYALNEATALRIDLLTQEGEAVQNLLSQRMPAGIYVLQFDSSELPGGLYYLRIQTESGGQLYPLVKQ